MAKKPSTKSTTPANNNVTVHDVPHAPIIYFDGVPNFGNRNGIVNVTLGTVRHLAKGAAIDSDIVAVAHLRCTQKAALDLRTSIDKALLLGAPAKGIKN